MLFAAVAAILVSACAQETDDNVMVETFDIRQDLQTLSEARVLLGHQSVGRNILAGLQLLAADEGVPLRILEIDGVPPDDGPGIFHSNIGRNGDPDSKCEVFSSLLNRPEAPRYDVGMLKFCYADIGRDTGVEVAAMLERYANTIAQIRRDRPDVRIVHVTMPLKADPPGFKTKVKRLIGYATWTDPDNILRNAFNSALRERYANEPFFDLAAVESTLRDGSRSAFKHEGDVVYTLAGAYTDDGGHLNELGQRLAAAEFVKTLAGVLRSS